MAGRVHLAFFPSQIDSDADDLGDEAHVSSLVSLPTLHVLHRQSVAPRELVLFDVEVV